MLNRLSAKFDVRWNHCKDENGRKQVVLHFLCCNRSSSRAAERLVFGYYVFLAMYTTSLTSFHRYDEDSLRAAHERADCTSACPLEMRKGHSTATSEQARLGRPGRSQMTRPSRGLQTVGLLNNTVLLRSSLTYRSIRGKQRPGCPLFENLVWSPPPR